jgi:chemotaxis protein CheD
MMDMENVFDIGRRNCLAMRKILWKAGVLLNGEAVGGVRSRTVRLEVGSGKFWIQEAGEVRELTAGLPRIGAA